MASDASGECHATFSTPTSGLQLLAVFPFAQIFSFGPNVGGKSEISAFGCFWTELETLVLFLSVSRNSVSNNDLILKKG